MQFSITVGTNFNLERRLWTDSHLPNLGTIVVNGNTTLTPEQYTINGFTRQHFNLLEEVSLSYFPKEKTILINNQVNELYLDLLNILDEEFENLEEKVVVLELLLVFSNCRFNSYVCIEPVV